MKSLTQTGAAHFVQNFAATATSAGVGVGDIPTIRRRRSFVVSEGTAQFNELRDCMLREADRSLIAATNCFARGLDGLRASASFWSLVALYYSAFFSAKSLMAMHGCWMNGPNSWIEVVDSNPGAQKLAFRTTAYSVGGSHQVTWAAYYKCIAPLAAWFTSAHVALAVAPVNSSTRWLIDTRNEFNYDPAKAMRMCRDFEASFDPANIPNCFTGKFKTMYEIAHAFILFARDSAHAYALQTDVFIPPLRQSWIQAQVTAAQHPQLTAFSTARHPDLEF